MSFIADEKEQEQYDTLYSDYMKNKSNCIAYHGEEIERAINALKMIIIDINKHGHDVKVCDLVDIF